MILGPDRKYLQDLFFFSDVTDKFNLFDVPLSYGSSNNATEGWCRVAVATKHSKSGHEASRGWVQRQNSPLAWEKFYNKRQIVAI